MRNPDRSQSQRRHRWKSAIALVTAIGTMTFSSGWVDAEEPMIEFDAAFAVELSAHAEVGSVEAETGARYTGVLLATRNVLGFEARIELKEKDLGDAKKRSQAVEKVRKEIAKVDGVVWVDTMSGQRLRDDRFHAWPATDVERASAGDLVGQDAFASLELPEVHSHATGDGTVVAVLDTGVDSSHELLSGSVLPGIDLVDDDDDASEFADGVDQDGDGLVDEAHGHGTFVAGVILQIAPDASILPVRVLDADGAGELYAVIEGIEFAIEQGADVINLSLGMDAEVESKRLKEAVKIAKDHGVIVVAAAGNDASDRKHFPAALDKVISVTALGESQTSLARYATRGKWVSVAAPGSGVVSSVPDGGYARWAGTSMATPVVAGGVALMREVEPELSASDFGKAMKKVAQDLELDKQVDSGALTLLAMFDEV